MVGQPLQSIISLALTFEILAFDITSILLYSKNDDAIIFLLLFGQIGLKHSARHTSTQ
jgi:hypothetical protein